MIPQHCIAPRVTSTRGVAYEGRFEYRPLLVGMYQLRMRFDGRFADPLLGRDSPEPYLPAVPSNGWGRFFVRYAATTSMITRHSGASRDVSLFF